MKNDIFVFHGCVLMLFNRMELAGDDKCDGSGVYCVLCEVNGDDPRAFFDVYDLHFVMPVDGDVGKIERDGAQVGDVGKHGISVWDFFLVVFVFKDIHRGLLFTVPKGDRPFQRDIFDEGSDGRTAFMFGAEWHKSCKCFVMIELYHF